MDPKATRDNSNSQDPASTNNINDNFNGKRLNNTQFISKNAKMNPMPIFDEASEVFMKTGFRLKDQALNKGKLEMHVNRFKNNTRTFQPQEVGKKLSVLN